VKGKWDTLTPSLSCNGSRSSNCRSSPPGGRRIDARACIPSWTCWPGQPNSICTLRYSERGHGFGVAEVKSLAKEYPDKLVVEVAPHSGAGRHSPRARLLA
jgi:hypothetical protein